MITLKFFDEKIIISNYATFENQGIKKGSSKSRDYTNESISRAKRKIYDLGVCNNWSHFLTMTFNSNKINRFNTNEVKKKFIKYLKNYSRIDKDFKYLVIPELHKNGALHFHGLVSFGENSKQFLKRFKKNIFNHKLFTEKFGFNRFIEIVEKSNAVISYIVKYVSKDVNKIFRNYYFHSNNLQEPLKVKITDDKIVLETIRKMEPLINAKVPELHFFQNVYVSSYVINKTNELYDYYYNTFFENIQVER